jgi:peptide deformylase
MTLVDSNDPILREPCEKFNFISPQVDLREFGNDLVKTMYEHNGLGLSANQVGVPLQIFTMRTETPLLIINPRIIEVSKELVELEEGCLSFPNELVKVKRPIWIIARYIQANGKGHTQKFEGMTARVFQHEMDHMMGKTMFDYLSRLKRDMAAKKKAKQQKKR